MRRRRSSDCGLMRPNHCSLRERANEEATRPMQTRMSSAYSAPRAQERFRGGVSMPLGLRRLYLATATDHARQELFLK